MRSKNLCSPGVATRPVTHSYASAGDLQFGAYYLLFYLFFEKNYDLKSYKVRFKYLSFADNDNDIILGDYFFNISVSILLFQCEK